MAWTREEMAQRARGSEQRPLAGQAGAERAQLALGRLSHHASTAGQHRVGAEAPGVRLVHEREIRRAVQAHTVRLLSPMT